MKPSVKRRERVLCKKKMRKLIPQRGSIEPAMLRMAYGLVAAIAKKTAETRDGRGVRIRAVREAAWSVGVSRELAAPTDVFAGLVPYTYARNIFKRYCGAKTEVSREAVDYTRNIVRNVFALVLVSCKPEKKKRITARSLMLGITGNDMLRRVLDTAHIPNCGTPVTTTLLGY